MLSLRFATVSAAVSVALAGPGAVFCVPACHSAFMACIAGSAGPQGAVTVGLCYAAVTACDASCVGATCLDGTNQVMTDHGAKDIAEVNVGDAVVTLTDAGELVSTTVLLNLKTEGDVSFKEIRLHDGTTFNATDEHIVGVRRSSALLEVEQAQQVKVGDDMLTADGTYATVQSVRPVTKTSKWTLATAMGTVLVNGVYMTAVCDDSFSEMPKDFSAATAWWRDHHHGSLSGGDGTITI